METFTRESLVTRLKEIKNMGWIANRRHGNVGGVGNTIEDLLGIQENNFKTPDAGEWEIKCQRLETSSHTTLLHCEPLPRSARIVPRILLPLYGWSHAEANSKYPDTEKSFRQTIHGLSRSDRGFKVDVDRMNSKIKISFDAKYVTSRHSEWLESVRNRVGLGELSPQPYWDLDELAHKIEAKLKNCCYLKAQVRKEGDQEWFFYNEIILFEGFDLAVFLNLLENGDAYIDFDARTGHNHGTKIRVKKGKLRDIYLINSII